MRRMATVILVVAASSACTPRARDPAFADASWSPFSPPGSDCSVDLPGLPAPDPSAHDTAVGRVELRQYVLVASGHQFEVGWMDFPVPFPREQVRELLRGSVETAAPGARLLGERDADLGEHPGVSGRHHARSGATVEQRMVAVGGRVYSLVVQGPSRRFDGDAARRFLGSLRLDDPAAAERIARTAGEQVQSMASRAEAAWTSALDRAAEEPGTPEWLDDAEVGFRTWMPGGVTSESVEALTGRQAFHAAVGDEVTCAVLVQTSRAAAELREGAGLRMLTTELLTGAGCEASSQVQRTVEGRVQLVTRAEAPHLAMEVLATRVGSHHVVLMAWSDVGHDTPEARRFLDSFQVLPRSP